MQHVDPDDLALIALGEPASDADRAHLDACTACAGEVSSLAAVVAVGRSVTGGDTLVAPPPAAWDRIRSELGLAEDARPGGAQRRGPATPDGGVHPATTVPPGRPPAAGAPDPAGTAGLAPVVPLRRRAVGWIAAAAAGGLLVGGVAGAWLAGRGDGGAPGTVLAEAALDPLPGRDARGDARVEQAAGGDRVLVVTLDGEQGDDGYHEVWLIDRGVTRLVSLGVLTGSEGRFTVPPGLDLAEFPVVDVSDEPYDGDPSHSGDSIIRGILDA